MVMVKQLNNYEDVENMGNNKFLGLRWGNKTKI